VSVSNQSRSAPIDGEPRVASRRRFLRTASEIAVTTPAVTLLLSGGTKAGLATGGSGVCNPDVAVQLDAQDPGASKDAAAENPCFEDPLE
jgi:hypothetical protein